MNPAIPWLTRSGGWICEVKRQYRENLYGFNGWCSKAMQGWFCYVFPFLFLKNLHDIFGFDLNIVYEVKSNSV